MFKTKVKPLDINDELLSFVKHEAQQIVKDDQKYPRKYRTTNFYKKLSPKLLEIVQGIMVQHEEASNLIWHYEVFVSKQPVGPHNDRNFFLEREERCDRGMIIPLEWVGLQPKTRFFDLFFEDKVNWDGEGFSTLSKEKKLYDKSCMDRTEDLVWSEKTIIFFDSRQVHEATPFSTTEGDYKLSINGLGYSKTN